MWDSMGYHGTIWASMDFHSKSLVILEVFRSSIWDGQGERKSKSGLSGGMAHYLSLNCGKTMFLLCSNCGTSNSKLGLRQERRRRRRRIESECQYRGLRGGSSKERNARRPVSRVLSLQHCRGWPFIWDARCRAPRATDPDGGVETRLPPTSCERGGGRPSLLGLAPGGVCPAAPVAGGAVRSYRPVSPLPAPRRLAGGLLSVALSLGSPPPGVTRHRVSMEPGLSSPRASLQADRAEGSHPAVWPHRGRL